LSIFLGKKIGGQWSFSVLPALFSISSVLLLYLIDSNSQEQIFILLATVLYYLALLGALRLSKYAGDKTARGMVMATTASTIFFTYTSFFGIYLNFAIPLYLMLIAYLAVTLLVSYQYLSLVKTDDKIMVWIYSFLLSLSAVEIIWTMNFWPFGYLTTGVIALILYYVLWDIVQSYFLGILSKKRVVANTVLFSALIILIFLSSKWIPVI
jgi:hypothetical protein